MKKHGIKISDLHSFRLSGVNAIGAMKARLAQLKDIAEMVKREYGISRWADTVRAQAEEVAAKTKNIAAVEARILEIDAQLTTALVEEEAEHGALQAK